jgi:hypothetical protein
MGKRRTRRVEINLSQEKTAWGVRPGAKVHSDLPSNGFRRSFSSHPIQIMKSIHARLFSIVAVVLGLITITVAHADDFKPEPGYVSLFNGKDLTGWGYKTNNFDGKTVSDDGRYSVRDGILVVNPREPRLIQKLWTTQEFPKDFNLRLEFRAATNADSGIYIRGPQLQCRDYLVAGPYKQLKQYKPQDWNLIEATVTNGVAYCTCNGEVLEAAMKVPATGSIGFEGDRDQMEYRRIRLKELP